MEIKDLENYSVYPGEFIPAANEAFIIKQVKKMTDQEPDRACTNIKEFIDEYKVQIAAPGFEREQLIVFADKNDLLICASYSNNAFKPGKCFRTHVNLPENADVELSIAEYRNNVLEMYVPKAKQPCKSCTTRIIVY